MSITISKKLALPLDIAAAMMNPDNIVIVTTVYNPQDSRVYVTLENISPDGAADLAEKATMAVLRETRDSLSAIQGARP